MTTSSAPVSRKRVASGGEEAVDTFDHAAIVRQDDLPLVINAERPDIAVVVGDETDHARSRSMRSILTFARAGNDRRSDHIGKAGRGAKPAGRRVIDRCGRVGGG